jgi:serine protease inhibitor
MIFSLCGAAVVSVTPRLDAQSLRGVGVVIGVVSDSSQGPVAGARVFLEGQKNTARTDADGRFRFDSVPEGTVAIDVIQMGYPHYSRSDLRVSRNDTLRVDIRLRPYDYVPPEQALLQTDSSAMGAYVASAKTTGAAYTDFSLNLFRSVAGEAAETNVFISPASAAFALAMASSGASGETWTAMSRSLGVWPMSHVALGDENAVELSSLASQSGVQLRIANSIWASDASPFLPQFLADARRLYHAEVTSLTLHGPVAQRRINDWVSTATSGRISDILDDTLPDTESMVLINAVYFKGKWLTPFDSVQTKPQPFTLPGHHVVVRARMARWDSIQYTKDTAMQMVRLPYQGGRVAMYVILPDSSLSPTAVLSRLTQDRWSRWMQMLKAEDVHLELPRFLLTYRKSLNKALTSLGMANAFDCQKATFGLMLPPAYLQRHPTCIGDVIQKTFIEVDEQGTEAAAVTSVGMLESVTVVTPPPPIEFVVDRPFFVAIRDDKTGLLLFLGQIVDPSAP